MKEDVYAARFQNREDVLHYESVEYAPDSYASYIWSLQQPKVAELFKKYVPATDARLLDFACGTGRVLSFVENLVAHSDGLDISPEMAEVAKQKCTKANITVGNILTEPDIVPGDYDVVTMFRFLLNTEQEMRYQVLREVRKRLVHKKGVLIANIHGNTISTRNAALAYRRLVHGESHSQLSRSQIFKMFEDTGYEVVEEYGFGLLPPLFYRTFLIGLAKSVDSWASKLPLMTPVSIDLLYVCRPV